ncbi:MAG: hypothetical protein VX185_16195 [Pseudomonadota bacterium]|nr:hypothetical protein [Pseudomonadota bacterium]
MKPRIRSWRPLDMLRWYNSFLTKPKESITSDELEAFFEGAKAYYNKSTEEAEKKWSLSRYRWRFDEKTSELVFEHQKGSLPTLKAKAQIISSFFVEPQEWHWSWAAPHLPKKSTADARRVRNFGRRMKQTPLYKSPVQLKTQKHLRHFMTALALSLSKKAETAYTGQGKDQEVVFLLHSIRVTENEKTS